ncbi:lysophospholipid acyltransferase family protein [Flavitalea flava]
MYYVVYGLLYLLSLLPMALLYPLADFLAFLLYHVIRYRRDIVLANLMIAFPEKTSAWRIKVAKRFYRNFVDNFIETLKLLSASPSFIREHFIIDNPEILEDFYKSGRKCQVHLGHSFNWEMANVAMPLQTSYPFLVVYLPLENKLFNRLFLHLRTRTGTVLLPATSMQKAILPHRGTQYLLTLVADQAPPGNGENAYWLDFFNHPTAFLKAPERGARIADIPVVFVRFYKTRRGYYRVRLEIGDDHPATLPKGELTRRYARFLEDAIRQSPDLWLWSHKRWKNKWKEEYAPLRID